MPIDLMEKTAAALETLDRRTTEYKTNQEKLLSDVTRLDANTKQTMEELTKVKENANDFTATLAKLRMQMALQGRASFGDPLSRFCADEEKRTWLNGCMRKAMNLPLSPAQRTAVTGVDSGIGAASTPQETAAMIYDILLQYGQWNTLGVMPIGSRTQIIPLISVRPTAYWVAQGAQITEGAFTGTSVTLTIKEASAWIPVASALIQDTEVDMSRWVLEQLGQSVAYRLDWACFAADGTDDTTDGAYTGIASGGTAAGAGSATAVADLDLDDFVRCLTTVGAGVLKPGSKWWIHPQILAKICQIKDLNGRPIFQTAIEAPSPGAIGSILGYPVVVTGAMPSTDAASQVVAVFGDPNGMAVGVRQQFEFATSTDFQFDYNRTAFRVVIRAGCVIKLATAFAKLTLHA